MGSVRCPPKKIVLLTGEIFFSAWVGFSGSGLPGEKFYTIQMGSFSKSENAEKLFDLTRQKLNPDERLFLRIEKNEAFFTLKIGKFNTSEEAQRLLKKIKLIARHAYITQRGFGNPVIRQYEPAAISGPLETDSLPGVLRQVSLGLQQKQYDHTQKLLQAGIRKWPDSHELYGYQGKIFFERKEPEKALRSFQQAISLAPPARADYYNGAGHCLITLKKPQTAIWHFQKALGIQPESPESLAGLGYVLLMELNKPERALEYFQQAIFLSPDEVDSHIGAGHCLIGMKKPHAAQWHFQKSLDIQPESPDCLAGLALTYTYLDREADARNVFNQLKHIDAQTARKVYKKMIAIKENRGRNPVH